MTAFFKAPDVPWMGPWSSMKEIGYIGCAHIGSNTWMFIEVMGALSFWLRVKRATTNPRGTHFYRIRPLPDHLAIALQQRAH